MRSILRYAVLFASAIASFSNEFTAAQESQPFLGKDVAAWNKQLQSTVLQERHEAAWAIAQLGTHAEGELLAAAGNADPVVRYWALQGLGQLALARTASSDPVLRPLQSALTDQSAAPRIAAAFQLARLGSLRAALPVLIAALDEPQESAALQAAAALAALGKKAEPARARLKLAAENGGEYVKRLASRALANLDEE